MEQKQKKMTEADSLGPWMEQKQKRWQADSLGPWMEQKQKCDRCWV